jgi:hypothetical protein
MGANEFLEEFTKSRSCHRTTFARARSAYVPDTLRTRDPIID